MIINRLGIYVRLLAIVSFQVLMSAASASGGKSIPLPEKKELPRALPDKTSSTWSAKVANDVIPLPVRNPTRRPSGSSLGDSEVIAWPTNDIIEAQKLCEDILGDVIMVFDVSPPMRKGACGTPAPIRLKAIGSSPVVHISPPAKVNCKLAKALHTWLTKKIQPAAEKYFQSKIVKIRNLASYSCRNRYSNPSKKISEHAFANALDIASFITADNRKIDLLKDWGPTQRDIAAKRRKEKEARKKRLAALKSKKDNSGKVIKIKSSVPQARNMLSTQSIDKSSEKTDNPDEEKEVIPLPVFRNDVLRDTDKSRKADFLHQIHADACGIFGTVLGPEANDAHRNHFHVDLAPRRRSAYCE